MIKWPMKMWLWGKDGIFVASNRPPDPGGDLIAISVYPTDQAPEPVAVLNIGDGCGLALAPGAWLRVRNLPPGQHALYLAPPSESASRSSEPFKAAVLDALTINWALKAEHETDARLAVADLIAAETAIALDPAVSSDAQALIDKGRASERERTAKMRDLLLAILDVTKGPWPRQNQWTEICAIARECAAAIRKLGDE